MRYCEASSRNPQLSQLLNDASKGSLRVDFERSSYDPNLLESVKVTGLEISKSFSEISDSNRVSVLMNIYFTASNRSFGQGNTKIELNDDQIDKLRGGRLLKLESIVQEIPGDRADALKERLDEGDSIEYRLTLNLSLEDAGGGGSLRQLMSFVGSLSPTKTD